VQLWETRTGRLMETLQGHSSAVWAVALSANGHLVASGGIDGMLRACGRPGPGAPWRRCPAMPGQCGAWHSRLTAACLRVAERTAGLGCEISARGACELPLRLTPALCTARRCRRMANSWSAEDLMAW
jgi:hypothetical protein